MAEKRKTAPRKRTTRETSHSTAPKPTEEPLSAPIPKNAPTAAPASLNDRRADGAAVLGGFVDVVDGEHRGRYGVFIEVEPDGETAIVRTRDADTVRISVPIADLRPAEPGRR